MKKFFLLLIVFFCTFSTWAQNVGIGTSSPSAKLHINSTTSNPMIINGVAPMYITFAESGVNRGYIGSFYGNIEDIDFGTYSGNINGAIHLTTNGSIRFTVDQDGNVGVGTTAPQQLFSVADGIVIDQSNFNTGTSNHILRFGSNSGEGIGSARTTAINQFGLDFYTNNLQRVTITNGGNMGINMLTPTSKLEIRGALGFSSTTKKWELNYDSTAGYFYIDEFGLSRRLYIKNGGNVGIGNSNPLEKLHINGAMIVGNTTNNNTGTVRFNSSNNDFEGYDGSQWRSFTATGDALPPIADTSINISNSGQLGFSVDVNNEFAVAGAPFDDIGGNADQGSITIYKKHPVTGKWIFYQKITLVSGAAGDKFGYAVTMDKNFIAVGSPYRDVTGKIDAGAVFIYKLNLNTGLWESFSWSTATYLSPSLAGDNFGFSVDLNNYLLLIGAPGDDINANIDQGSFYVYQYTLTLGPYQEDFVGSYNLTSTDGQPNDKFGYVVRIISATGSTNGTGTIKTAAISAPFNNSDGVSDKGAVYIFQLLFNNFTQTGKISPANGGINNQFGISIDYALNTMYEEVIAPYQHQLAIGSKKDNGAQINQGYTYLYNGEAAGGSGTVPISWTYATSFTNSDGSTNNLFGNAVKFINSESLLIGCPGNGTAGALYRYIKLGNNSWQFDKKITDASASSGEQMGYSIAISGTDYASGAPGYSYGVKTNAGKVFFGSTIY
jgi:hypothetical protein